MELASKFSFGDGIELTLNGFILSIPTVIANSLLFQFPSVFTIKTTSEIFSTMIQGPVQYIESFNPILFSVVGVKTHTFVQFFVGNFGIPVFVCLSSLAFPHVAIDRAQFHPECLDIVCVFVIDVVVVNDI